MSHNVTGWGLHYKEGSSDKYYNVFVVDDGHLVLNWGRSGTAGQVKVEKYTLEEAQNMARRQVYAKASKGYKMLAEDHVFQIDDDVHRMMMRGNVNTLVLTMKSIMNDEQFTRRQRLVTGHYDGFIEETNRVLDAAASGESFDDLLPMWERLSKTWTELDEKHQHALTAVRLVQQTVSQKLMGV